MDETRLEAFGRFFLDMLMAALERTLTVAIEKNILAAHEAKSAARHRLLLDELDNVQHNLNQYDRKMKFDAKAVREINGLLR